MPTLITFRHGERFKDTMEKSGDGPLTRDGIQMVQDQSLELARSLMRENSAAHVDLAVVSGSIRCAQTFGFIWETLHRNTIAIAEYDMDRKFFGTKEEDQGWSVLYATRKNQLRRLTERFGERKAVMMLAGHLVHPCVDRTVRRIKREFRDGAETILVVTHGPHEALIGEAITGKECGECIEVGKYRILDF